MGNTAYGARICTAIFTGQKAELVSCREKEETNFSELYQFSEGDYRKIEKKLVRKIYFNKIGAQHACDYHGLKQRPPADD